MKSAEDWLKEYPGSMFSVAPETIRQIQADALRWAAAHHAKSNDNSYLEILNQANQLDPKPEKPTENPEYHCTSRHIAIECPGCIYCQ